MSGGFSVTFEGAAELEAALLELPKRVTEKAVVRRALTLAAEPTRDLASAIAPFNGEDIGMHLNEAILVSTKTKSRQTLENARPGDVVVYIGPNKDLPRHHGMEMEFGTFKDRPQPFMRPAWVATRDQDMALLGYYMWVQIDATAQRLAARSARAR